MAVISVIIINYNTAQLTLQALSSIDQFVPDNTLYEFIVVDNASSENDFNTLTAGINKLNFTVRLIKSRINLGFGGGNMLGVQFAQGDYYIFMNSDVILNQDSFGSMISFLEKNQNAAMVGCQAVDQNNAKYKSFDYALSVPTLFISDSILHKINPKKYPKRTLGGNQPVKVDAVPGSLFACIARDFDRVGGFDTNIFLYFEEKDLAYRIVKSLKKDIFSLPYITYTHLKGKSTKKTSQAILNEMKISQFYVVRKNLGTLVYIFFYIYSLLKFAVKSFFNNKNRSYLMLLIRGVSLSESLKTSQKIQK